MLSFSSKIVDLVYRAARFFRVHGILCLIEPLSTRANYYLRSYSTAVDIVKSSNMDNLKVMLDSFHLQRLHGNLTERVQVIHLLGRLFDGMTLSCRGNEPVRWTCANFTDTKP